MTSDAIVRRNRANAAKSTGPRTPVGKAVVSRNARRHGATARLDPDRVHLWLRIILAAPHLGREAADIAVDEEGAVVALALAKAEERYVLAEQALRNFVAGELARTGVIEVVPDDPGSLRGRASAGGPGTQGQPRTRDAGDRGARALDAGGGPGGRLHRRLLRYLDEAQRRRARAFSAWLSQG